MNAAHVDGRSLPKPSGLQRQRCKLCKRRGAPMTRHHLTPREVGGPPEFKQGNVIVLCVDCHASLHWNFSNRELAVLNSMASLWANRVVRAIASEVSRRPVDRRFVWKPLGQRAREDFPA